MLGIKILRDPVSVEESTSVRGSELSEWQTSQKKWPHQALLNFTPGYVHRMGNKSVLYALNKEQVQIAKEQRIAFNRSKMSQLSSVSN